MGDAKLAAPMRFGFVFIRVHSWLFAVPAKQNASHRCGGVGVHSGRNER